MAVCRFVGGNFGSRVLLSLAPTVSLPLTAASSLIESNNTNISFDNVALNISIVPTTSDVGFFSAALRPGGRDPFDPFYVVKLILPSGSVRFNLESFTRLITITRSLLYVSSFIPIYLLERMAHPFT